MECDAGTQTTIGPWKRVAAALAVSALAACSGSGSDAVSSAGSRQSEEVRQGFFRGGNVAGLTYVSGRQSGQTGVDGGYECEPATAVSFAVGALTLGETDCTTLAHAAALSPSGELTDPTSLNIMRLLLMLDHDENPDNGVFISEPLRSIAQNWAPVDFGSTDFEAQLASIISDIASVDGRIVDEVPGNDDAFVFLDASVSCAFSGVYYQVFNSGPLIATNVVTLSIFRDSESNVDIGDFLLVRQHPVTGLVAVGIGEMPLSAQPSIVSADFSADFLGADVLSVSWSNAFAQQSWDRAGSTFATRLGGISGDYRFAGKIEALSTALQRSVQMRIELRLEGDNFFGETIDNGQGVRYPVTGSRLSGSNEFELEIESLGLATGTIVVDADGEPIGMRGNWPGYDEDVFEAVGCRLK